MRRILSTVLAAIVLCSLGITVFAEVQSPPNGSFPPGTETPASPSVTDGNNSDTYQNQNSGDSVVPRNIFDYNGTDVPASLESGDFYRQSNAYFRDEAEVLNIDDYETVSTVVQQTADKIGMNVGVFIGGNQRSDKQTETFAEAAAIQLFGNDADTNTVFVYIDFEGQSVSYDYIFTYHDAQLYYPNGGKNSRLQVILDNMYNYLPASGDPVYSSSVYKAIEACCGTLIKYNERGPENNASYKNEELGKYRSVVFGYIVNTRFFPLSLTTIVVVGFIGLIILLSILTSIGNIFRRRSTGYNNYYNSYNGYYDGYGNPPPPPPSGHRRRRMSHRSSHHSSGGSHHSSHRSSGGGGRHR